MTTIEEANVRLVHELVGLINDRHYDKLDQIFADHFVDHRPGRDTSSLAELKKAQADDRDEFDFTHEVRDTIAADDKVFLGSASIGRQARTLFGRAGTGRTVNLSTFEIFRFEGGRIAERWILRDLLSLAPQLGAAVPGLDLEALAEYDFYSKWSLRTAQMPSRTGGDNNLQTVFRMFQALGARDNRLLDEAMAEDFQDHHPGIGDVASSAEYKRNIASFFESMSMTGRTDVIFARGDRVVNRATMMGKHVGPFFGVPATGRDVAWTTIEVYRIEKNRVQERWAIDDLYGLFGQLGVAL